MMRMITVSKSACIIALLIFSFSGSLAQDNAAVIHEIEAHRKKQQSEFRDKVKSPLTKKDRRRFKGLNYYPIDLKYRIEARFVKTENAGLFKMKTTTDRLPEYRKYGEVHFSIDGAGHKLEVYQSPDIMKRPGYEDYLFIPFTDLTNGHETYEVGRYLEFRIPQSENVIIDFNQSYNPYCSYSPNYSCPIPPAANNLSVAIPVGEKKFKEH